MDTYGWSVGGGQSVQFTIYGKTVAWNNAAGLYIFAGKRGAGWDAFYVGQTENFSDRIPQHDQWDNAVRLGATHVHAVVVPLAARRDELEKLLIQHLQPPLNVQHR